MYKTKLIIALLVSGISCAAFAADEAIGTSVGGLPLGGLAKGAEPKTTDVNGVPLVEDNNKPKLKSVKDLFKSSKNSAPKAPDIISDKPEIMDVENLDTQPQQPVTTETPAPIAPPTGTAAEPEKPKAQAPAIETPSAETPANTVENTTNPNEQPSKKDASEEKETKVDTSTEGSSIMFDQTNIYRAMRVLSAYIESQSNKVDAAVQEQSKKSLEELQQELLAKLKPEDFVKGKSDIVTIRLPAYVRVDTLIFRSPTNKKVWVNSRLFVEDDSTGELTVKDIQPEWAYIELSAKDTNIGLDKFEKLLKKSKNPDNVKIDLVKQTISFRLSVNQYIDLVSLKIKEGKFTGS